MYCTCRGTGQVTVLFLYYFGFVWKNLPGLHKDVEIQQNLQEKVATCQIQTERHRLIDPSDSNPNMLVHNATANPSMSGYDRG